MRPELSNPAALILLLAIPAGVAIAWSRGLFSKDSGAGKRLRARGFLAAGIRTLIVLVLVLGLSGLRVKTRTDDLAVIFLVDVSASVLQSELPAVSEFINAEVDRARPTDYIGIIAFGAEPSVELGPTRKEDLAGWQLADIKSRPDRDHTDIAAALRLAAGLAPEGATLRLVLISDGDENLEQALPVAPLLAARGIRVFTMGAKTLAWLPEIAVRNISAPDRVAEGESFEVKVGLESTREAGAKLRLFRNNSLVSERQVHLVPSGENQFVLSERPDRKGFYTYRAEIESPDQDTFKQNNAREAIVQVEGRPKTLYVYGDDKPSAAIARVLLEGNFNPDIVPAAGIPTGLAGFQDYDLIIFDNVPATRLTAGQMMMVRSYVHDLGGGFIMIGGENSFGPGGYYKSAVADVLPVSLDVRKKKHFPSLALAIVIDKSGSMNEYQGNAVKIELAKQAAVAALDSLSERDQACVITFDTEAHLVLPLTAADDKRAIHSAVDQIEADGGTAIYTGLKQAYESLAASDAQIKHVILLSDGESMDGDYQGITRAMRDANMTLSSVAVGDEADIGLMQMLAGAGGGRFYSTENAENLPSIFTREAFMASRSIIIEEPFIPQLSVRSQATAGIDWSRAPQILGYVGTAERGEPGVDQDAAGASDARSAAVVSLVSDKGDPIYAEWQYGLGHAAAFTSDAKPRWAASWMNWPGFGQFWEQVMRANLRRDDAAGDLKLRASVHFDDESAYRRQSIDFAPGEFGAGRMGHISVEATDPAGRFANSLELRARIIAPDLSSTTSVLEQTASGLYETGFLAAKRGPYIVNIERGAASIGAVGAVKSYSPEYDIAEGDASLLARLSEITSGDLIQGPSPVPSVNAAGGSESAGVDKTITGASFVGRDLFDHSQTNTIPHEIWERLFLIAVLLLPLDVAVRRLSITRRDLREAGARARLLLVSGLQYARYGRIGEDAGRLQGIARLKASRQRLRLRPPARDGHQPVDSSAPVIITGAEGEQAGAVPNPPPLTEPSPAKNPPPVTQPTASPDSTPPSGPAGPEAAALATRLLESKRKRQQ